MGEGAHRNPQFCSCLDRSGANVDGIQSKTFLEDRALDLGVCANCTVHVRIESDLLDTPRVSQGWRAGFCVENQAHNLLLK